jgi:hypothetical protein
MKLLFGSILLSLMMACGASAATAGDGTTFPAIAGWTLAPPPGDSVYTPDNLWDIIDGAAELFLSYGFVDLRIGEYSDSAGTDVRVELYRHSSRENAFGMYSQERIPDYHFIEIGTQGYVEERVLNFFTGVYYVKISSHRDGQTGINAMLLIGRRVAEHLQQEPGWPAVLALLPAEKRIANTESFIAENFLGYSFFHSAFTRRYEQGLTLFVMDFDSPSRARAAADAYLKTIGLPPGVPENAITDISDPHNGPLVMLVRGRRVSGGFGSVEKAVAHRYLGLLRERLPAEN